MRDQASKFYYWVMSKNREGGLYFLGHHEALVLVMNHLRRMSRTAALSLLSPEPNKPISFQP